MGKQRTELGAKCIINTVILLLLVNIYWQLIGVNY